MEISFPHIIQLLKDLIKEPSFSREEDKTAKIIEMFFTERNIPVKRKHNNIWTWNKHFSKKKPTILLNSHHDTVKPHADWQRDPFSPGVESNKLFGLGSNDAGGALVSLMASFIEYYDRSDLTYNLVFLASAEEEISGAHGVESVLDELPAINFGIVGEPTKMQMAIAEKGLIVLDCVAKGISGHAARESGRNAIYQALDDINWVRKYPFSLISPTLGKVRMSVTMVNAGSQHNVIPDRCQFVIDVRSTDAYTNEEILQIIKDNLKSEVHARSIRLQPSRIQEDHEIIAIAKKLKIKTFGSDTLSDQALMRFPTVKIGPGDSSRSHIADEYIYVDELQEGIEIYNRILKAFNEK